MKSTPMELHVLWAVDLDNDDADCCIAIGPAAALLSRRIRVLVGNPDWISTKVSTLNIEQDGRGPILLAEILAEGYNDCLRPAHGFHEQYTTREKAKQG